MQRRDGIEEGQTTRWNQQAGHGWVAAQAVIDQVLAPLEELLLEAVEPGGAARVLDVGCGTGGTTVAVARRLGPNGRSVGIDVSEPMIDAARARAERDGVPASFIRADAQTHPLEPASFDTIVSRFGVMFFDDPVAAFANLRRAARADGALHVVAWRSAAENPFMTTAERAAAPLLPDLPVRADEAPGQFAFADPRRVEAILQQAGWTSIDVQPVDVTCSMPEQELVGYLTRLGPVAGALQTADDRLREQVIATVRPAFDPYVDGADVRFTAACWIVDAR